MSTGLFADEEDGYNLEEHNLEETKYVLKGSAPSTDSSMEPTEEPLGDELEGGEDLSLDGLDDAEPSAEKPFDDEPFDAGVEADEDTDPTKFIQQLSGKLGQSLRQYSEDEGQPDFDLEKFAVNSVLSATHTGEMDKEDQRDIINKVKGSGNEDPEDMSDNGEEEVSDEEPEVDGEESLDFGEEPVEEIVEELPLNQGDGMPEPTDCSMMMNPIDNEALEALKDVVELEEVDSKFGNDERFGNDKRWGLQESEESSTFVDRENIIKTLRLMDNSEPMVEPQPITKPSITPSRPTRETDRPFLPKRKDKVKPDPKAEDNGMVNEIGDTSVIEFDGKQVSISSLQIEDVDIKDYPDFTDAYFVYGEYADAIEMSDEELVKFQDENLELLGQLILDRQLYM